MSRKKAHAVPCETCGSRVGDHSADDPHCGYCGLANPQHSPQDCADDDSARITDRLLDELSEEYGLPFVVFAPGAEGRSHRLPGPGFQLDVELGFTLTIEAARALRDRCDAIISEYEQREEPGRFCPVLPVVRGELTGGRSVLHALARSLA